MNLSGQRLPPTSNLKEHTLLRGNGQLDWQFLCHSAMTMIDEELWGRSWHCQNCSVISKHYLKIVWFVPLEHILKGTKYTHLVQAYFKMDLWGQRGPPMANLLETHASNAHWYRRTPSNQAAPGIASSAVKSPEHDHLSGNLVDEPCGTHSQRTEKEFIFQNLNPQWINPKIGPWCPVGLSGGWTATLREPCSSENAYFLSLFAAK